MNKKNFLVRIFVKGGVITPGQLLQILKIAKNTGNYHIHFGSRQDILFYIEKQDLDNISKNLKRFDVNLVVEEDKIHIGQNITSSFVSSDIVQSTPWLTGGTYLNILDSFNFTPKLRINIVDPAQNLVPLIFGELNFIAAQKQNHWHLMVAIQSSHIEFKWPGLISSKDIPGLSKDLEEALLSNENININVLIEKINEKHQYYFIPNNEELELTQSFLPYYEGINPMMHNNNHWIGFYWKNNHYDIPFLEKTAVLCLKSDVSRIYITPWKSFLVKNIKKDGLLKWHETIGHFGINLRHSSFDLNWHLPLLSKKAYKLKNYIVKEFNKIDIRTYGLSFSIGHKIEGQFTAIVIVCSPLLKIGNKYLFKKYEIFYAKNFDVNSRAYNHYATVHDKKDIVKQLAILSREFYLKLSVPKVKISTQSKNIKIVRTYNIHQCQDCLTVYDPEYGDAVSGIDPGTGFSLLPEDYCCPTCSAPKQNFAKKSLETISK